MTGIQNALNMPNHIKKEPVPVIFENGILLEIAIYSAMINIGKKLIKNFTLNILLCFDRTGKKRPESLALQPDQRKHETKCKGAYHESTESKKY